MTLFGTNGVRGIANEFITPQLVMDIAKSLGTYLGSDKIVAIGRDTRISGQMLESAAIAGALSSGLSVIDVGMAPIPAIQYYTRDHADAGIAITASHNPREYNGIKLIAGDGSEFSRKGENEIEKIYYSRKYKAATWDCTGEIITDNSVNDNYIRGIMNAVDTEKIRSRKFRIAVDTGCGAGSLTLPFLLRKLGCEVITINSQIDGTFPWRNPEPTIEALGELKEVIQYSGADMGVAQDGDADRAVFFDEKGNFINEEVLLATVAKYILALKKGPIVTPVSSSQRMADVAKDAGVEIIWTAVGSINVARKMMETSAVFGGEGNGGFIFPEHQYCRDGGMACAKILEMMADGEKLSYITEGVPVYFNSKAKVYCDDLNKTVEAVKSEVLQSDETVDTTDGIKIWYEDGWLLIRPSGTEPLIRIFTESKTMTRAEELMKLGKEMVEKYR